MQHRRLGRTGLKVSVICLGTMTFGAQCDEAASVEIMNRASEGGVNFIDTADVYPVPVESGVSGRTEDIVGRWLRGKRDGFVLATKCRAGMGQLPWNSGLSRKHIIEAVDASLRRLQTDWIDLYQAHSPDSETPIEETLRAFDDLVHSGKVRYIGCSNFGAWQLAKALWTSDRLNIARFDCIQPRYNLLFRSIEDEVLPICRDEGIGVIPYNPLAGGFLTGKYREGSPAPAGTRFDVFQGRSPIYFDRYWKQAQFEAVERLAAHFGPQNIPLAQAAVAWILQQPGITSAIVGATRPEQLADTLAAPTLSLTEEDLAACNDAWYGLPRPRDPQLALR
ncbi:MAG: aldo/keto reductase [Armatimonadetes bacterium]|nr:aldo/keto reductase [Armatimonadota bacterium]MDE2205115.1 aldo/keto reductase [Armatimonadota bacterium]